MFFKYICSYLKQKMFFLFRKSIIKKNKGEAGDLVGEKRTFLGRQKFLANGVAGISKNWPSANFAHIVPSTSRNLNSNQKQKSYVNWKLCNAEKSKIMVAPSFGNECPNSTGFSWNEFKVGQFQFFVNHDYLLLLESDVELFTIFISCHVPSKQKNIVRCGGEKIIHSNILVQRDSWQKND